MSWAHHVNFKPYDLIAPKSCGAPPYSANAQRSKEDWGTQRRVSTDSYLRNKWMSSRPCQWLCSGTLVSNFDVLSTPPHHSFHPHSLAGKEATNAPGSLKIKCLSFMETLSSSGAFGAHFMFAGYVLKAGIVWKCIFYVKITEVVSNRLKIFLCVSKCEAMGHFILVWPCTYICVLCAYIKLNKKWLWRNSIRFSSVCRLYQGKAGWEVVLKQNSWFVWITDTVGPTLFCTPSPRILNLLLWALRLWSLDHSQQNHQAVYSIISKFLGLSLETHILASNLGDFLSMPKPEGYCPLW